MNKNTSLDASNWARAIESGHRDLQISNLGPDHGPTVSASRDVPRDINREPVVLKYAFQTRISTGRKGWSLSLRKDDRLNGSSRSGAQDSSKLKDIARPSTVWRRIPPDRQSRQKSLPARSTGAPRPAHAVVASMPSRPVACIGSAELSDPPRPARTRVAD
jgi:hypothetical protein